MNEQVDELKTFLKKILAKHDVKKAALFGSILRNDFAKDSDIDLLVEFKGRKSLLDLIRLKLELQELLGRKVDVLTYNSLHHLLKDKILHEQEVIFQ